VPTRDRSSSVGGWLIAIGCVWFVLALIWLPPILIVSSFFGPSEGFMRLTWPADFAISATVLTVGILLRRRASRGLSFTDYAVALVGVCVSVVTVWTLFGFIHLK
jgi:hypothetical protein